MRGMLVRHVVTVLGRAAIPVMPLKGALFAFWIYDDPCQRLGADIDLLVPEASFERSVALLVDAAFPVVSGSPGHYQVGLASPIVPIVIDLHRSLFPPGYYRLSTRDIFARGKRDLRLYDAPVTLPDPYDAYAHLMGHTAAFPFTYLPESTKADLELLVRRFDLDAARCADRLRETGLARAAFYTLGSLARSDPFGTVVVRHLHSDRLGRGLAWFAFTLARRFHHGSGPSKYSPLLTNAGLGQSSRMVLAGIQRRARRALGIAR
jgi:hypothetical protein